MAHEDRSRSSPLQADRPRQDSRESAEVHHPRRDDRPQGSRSGQHSRAAARRARISATARTAPAASARAMAKSARPSRRRRASKATARGRPAAILARTSWKSTSRWKNWPRSSATSWSCRASSPRAKPTSRRKRPLHQHPPHRARNRCGTSSAPTCRPCGGRSRRAPTTPTSPLIVPMREDKRYRSWKHDSAARSQRRGHLHDGRLRLDDRRAEGDRPHRGLLDRYLAQQPIRRRRSALHHPRRGGQGSRRRDVLPHARKRRHADQLGLQSRAPI